MFRKQSKLVVKELKPGLEYRERSENQSLRLGGDLWPGAEGREGRIRGRKKTGIALRRPAEERALLWSGWSVVSGDAGRTRRMRMERKILDINCGELVSSLDRSLTKQGIRPWV